MSADMWQAPEPDEEAAVAAARLRAKEEDERVQAEQARLEEEAAQAVRDAEAAGQRAEAATAAAEAARVAAERLPAVGRASCTLFASSHSTCTLCASSQSFRLSHEVFLQTEDAGGVGNECRVVHAR